MSKSNDAAELIELANTGHQGVKRTLTDLGYSTEQVAQLEAIVDVHADRFSATSNYFKIAGQPTHTVIIGKSADAHEGMAQSYQQMGLSATEFADVQIKQ